MSASLPAERSRYRVIVAWCAAVAGLIAVTVYIFASVPGYDWIVYDNNRMIQRHPGIVGGNIGDIFGTEPYRRMSVLYQPLVVLSMAADHKLFGLENKAGWAWHNLALHLAVIVLLLVLLYRLTGSLGAAFPATLLVAAHPLVVEPATWIICRTFLLAGLWILVGTHLYLSHLTRPRWWLLAGHVVCYSVSMLAKPLLGIVLLPLILDLWRRRRVTPLMLLEKVPFLVIAVAFTVINIRTVASGQGGLQPLVLEWTTLTGRVFQGTVLTLANTTLPAKQAFFYRFNGAWEVVGWRVWVVLGFGIAWLAAVLLAWRRFGRALLLCGLGWGLVFVPQLGAIRYRNTIAADRYAYVPLWFVGLGAAVILAYLLRRDGDASPTRRFAGYLCAAVVMVLALGGAQASQRYAQKWQDEITLWRDVVSQTPGAIPYGEMANVFLMRAKQAESREDRNGQYELAAEALEQAVQLEPGNFQMWMALGSVYRGLGQADKAVAALNESARICRAMGLHAQADQAEAQVGQLLSLVADGDTDDPKLLAARAQQFLKLAGQQAALAQQKSGQQDQAGAQEAFEAQASYAAQAVEVCRKLLEADPQSARIWTDLGHGLMYQGDAEQAFAAYAEAIRIQADFTPALAAWGRALAVHGQMDQAREKLKAALRADPDHTAALLDLAKIYVGTKRYAEAVPLMEKLHSQAPDSAYYCSILRQLYERTGRAEAAKKLPCQPGSGSSSSRAP